MEKRKADSSVRMQKSYLDHPPEEALERFLLNKCEETELERVETHILACESCVSRLEGLEVQIAATKLALQEFEARKKPPKSWKSWFTVPKLSFAWGTAAVLAIALFVFVPRDVSLTSYRGVENAVVPTGHPLNLHLNASGLPQGPIVVEMVDANGKQLWKRASTIRGDQVIVVAPIIHESGAHFARIYASGQSNSEGELLREFAFKAK